MIVEVSTHGSVIKRDHDSFVVKCGAESTEIPAEKVSAILVTANALVSTSAIKLAMEKQIQMVFAGWSGKPFARVWASSQGKASWLRRWQYMNQEGAVGLGIAADITRKKIRRQRALLAALAANRDARPPEADGALSALRAALESADKGGAAKDVLLGLEGWAAREYFAAISAMLPERWRFASRSQHPALDGFNAVLNYMYGIAYSDVERIIILTGLDPNAGFYHADAYGKPTLSYDLIELSRPAVDRGAITLFTRRIARDSWFEMQDRAVFLSKAGRANVIAKYVDSCKKPLEGETWKYCRKLTDMYKRTSA